MPTQPETEKIDSNPSSLASKSMNLAPFLFFLLKTNNVNINVKSQGYTDLRISTTSNNI